MSTLAGSTVPNDSESLLSQAKRFLALFKGNDRSSGRYNAETERMFVEYLPLDELAVLKHLSGDVGVGAVPITDEGFCTWGSIDMDCHGQEDDLPINDVDKLVRQHDLPVVLCRSKSGGIHAYAFFKDQQPAAKVRGLLMGWAEKLGYAGSEIFPKQSKLTVMSGKMSYGNWLNLPYHNTANGTQRYAVVDGKHLTLGEFLDFAESLRITDRRLKSIYLADNPEAPPCIQALLEKGVAQGQRNEAMYNIMVYYRKADPSTAETKGLQANQFVFKTPLPKAELQRTITSAMRPDYSYRCNEDVIKKHCDRPTCLKRKCGITPDEVDKQDTQEALPIFDNLAKYNTEPVRWEIDINGMRVQNIGTPQLLEWRCMRELIADRLTKVVPIIKNSEWERTLMPLMQVARIVDTPDDASVNGVVRDRLREFAAKADLHSTGEKTEDRKALLRGMPVVQVVDGERVVLFRGQDFVSYLKRTKSEEIKGVNLWFCIQQLGVTHKKIRVGGTKTSCNVWLVPVNVVSGELDAESAEFKSDL